MRNVIILGLVGTLIPSCGSDSKDNAAQCGAAYNLGCIGDGRSSWAPTPGSSPPTSCAKDSYTYFKVAVLTAAPRDEIASCTIAINDSSGSFAQQYALPSGQNGSGSS
jgi:hypothetical protein